MKTVYGIWCEYDIGQSKRLWSTKAAAFNWSKKACEDQKENGLEESFEELLDQGLIGVEKYELNE